MTFAWSEGINKDATCIFVYKLLVFTNNSAQYNTKICTEVFVMPHNFINKLNIHVSSSLMSLQNAIVLLCVIQFNSFCTFILRGLFYEGFYSLTFSIALARDILMI